jgi:hypothetical protein
MDLKHKPRSDRESRNCTLEFFWKDRNVDALVARLFVTRTLPLDLRRRIEHDVECLEWREYYSKMKHYDQTIKERRRDLIYELRRLGCEPRADSALCKGFVYSTLEPKTWTAKAVARRMAEMKYVHSYCDTFKREVEDMREKFENLCDRYMDEYDDEYDEYDDEYDEYDDEYDEYDRLDRADAREAACEDTTGYRYFGTYVSELAKNWKKFPKKWPWSIPDDIPEEDVDEAGDPREALDVERSELDEDNKDEGTGADENDENEEVEERTEGSDEDDFDEDGWSEDEFHVWYEDSSD